MRKNTVSVLQNISGDGTRVDRVAKKDQEKKEPFQPQFFMKREKSCSLYGR